MSKLTVELNDRFSSLLQELADAEGVPKTQVLRRSIAVLKFLEEERAKGNRIAVTDPDGKVIKEIVG